MKKRFFKYIEIDKELIKQFCEKHPQMHNFIDYSAPFYVRIGVKPFPTLVHTIISTKDDSNELINFRLDTLSKQLKNKITPRRILKITKDNFEYMVGKDNSQLIRAISQDIVDKKLNLKKLFKGSEHDIELALSVYKGISYNIIKQFALFGCFKKNVLCKEEKEFINGLKIFLNKDTISKEDIDNISKEYAGDWTLLSLCMFKICNEKAGK